MSKTSFCLVLVSVFIVAACENPDSWRMGQQSESGGEDVQNDDSDSGGGFFGGGTEKKAEKAVYADQTRNSPCWKTKDCQEGLICKSATNDTPGACSMDCGADSDCGNNFLCRMGSCQKDCAEAGEKCSDKRVCCFFDSDGDKTTDVMCVDREGDIRCQVAEEGEEAAEFPEPVEAEAL